MLGQNATKRDSTDNPGAPERTRCPTRAISSDHATATENIRLLSAPGGKQGSALCPAEKGGPWDQVDSKRADTADDLGSGSGDRPEPAGEAAAKRLRIAGRFRHPPASVAAIRLCPATAARPNRRYSLHESCTGQAVSRSSEHRRKLVRGPAGLCPTTVACPVPSKRPFARNLWNRHFPSPAESYRPLCASRRGAAFPDRWSAEIGGSQFPVGSRPR